MPNESKIDRAVLALLTLTSFEDHGGWRAWKGHDWDVLDRLHEQGFIADPKSKARSVVLTDEGLARSRELFDAMFGDESGA